MEFIVNGKWRFYFYFRPDDTVRLEVGENVGAKVSSKRTEISKGEKPLSAWNESHKFGQTFSVGISEYYLNDYSYYS